MKKSIRWAHMETNNPNRPKQKILVIMGATGTGKTRLSIDIATRIPSEIINADKIQLHRGLDITTNKVPMPDRRGVEHHLLGEFDPNIEISPLDYRSKADERIAQIIKRDRLPIVVGGSNSFINALVSARCLTGDPSADSGSAPKFRYSCCFIWVDVARSVLDEYLSQRVDEMLESGMFEELADYNTGSGVSSSSSSSTGSCRVGIKKAIGVPEFERYFECFPGRGRLEEDLAGRVVYEEAVEAIKRNTSQLAEIQVGKILRLRSTGWDMHRIDATESFRAVLSSDKDRFRLAWRKDVLEPSLKKLNRFLVVERAAATNLRRL